MNRSGIILDRQMMDEEPPPPGGGDESRIRERPGRNKAGRSPLFATWKRASRPIQFKSPNAGHKRVGIEMSPTLSDPVFAKENHQPRK